MKRLQIIATALLTIGLATSAAAQGRVMGIVQDDNGRPIKGATIRATNPDASAYERTATTDDRGRFFLLGLRLGGNWEFIAEAPGHFAAGGTATVRATPGEPLTFRLRRDPGPPPGSLTRDIQNSVTAANTLRDQGRYDEAITAYQAIQAKNPKLTTVNLVLAGIYRQKAEREIDPAARQALLDRADAAERAAAASTESK